MYGAALPAPAYQRPEWQIREPGHGPPVRSARPADPAQVARAGGRKKT